MRVFRVIEDGDRSQEDQQERLPLVVGSWLENPLQGPKGLGSMEMVQGLEISWGIWAAVQPRPQGMQV